MTLFISIYNSNWELTVGALLSVIMRPVMPKSTGEGEEEEEQKALKSERRCRDERRG